MISKIIFKNKSKLITIIIFIAGGTILLISEFIPWFSDEYSLWDIAIGASYLFESYYYYFIPLICSIIILILTFLLIFIKKLNNTVIYIILFINLTIYLIFLLEMFHIHNKYLYNSPGFFVGIAGIGTIFLGILWFLNTTSTSTSSLYAEKKN